MGATGNRVRPPPPARCIRGKGPQRQPHRRLDRRLEEVAKAAGGGYCRLQMRLKPALAVRRAVAGRRLGAAPATLRRPPRFADGLTRALHWGNAHSGHMF